MLPYVCEFVLFAPSAGRRPSVSPPRAQLVADRCRKGRHPMDCHQVRSSLVFTVHLHMAIRMGKPDPVGWHSTGQDQQSRNKKSLTAHRAERCAAHNMEQSNPALQHMCAPTMHHLTLSPRHVVGHQNASMQTRTLRGWCPSDPLTPPTRPSVTQTAHLRLFCASPLSCTAGGNCPSASFTLIASYVRHAPPPHYIKTPVCAHNIRTCSTTTTLTHLQTNSTGL